MWQVPAPADVNMYGDTFEGKNYCVASMNLPEVVWDLQYHPFQPKLLSVSTRLCLWDCKDTDKEIVPKEIEAGATPTCATWLG